jgi:hypothetical protein
LITDSIGRLIEDLETNSNNNLIKKPITLEELSNNSKGGVYLNIPNCREGVNRQISLDAALDLTNAYYYIISPKLYKEKQLRQKQLGRLQKKQ